LINFKLTGVLWQYNNNTDGVITNSDGSITTNAPYWEITDLNNRLADPSWQVFQAVDINNNGLILAQAYDANGVKHAVLLITLQMAVDNNRDGRISFGDEDRTTANNPYRFWINDSQEHDDDETSEGGSDDQIPRSSTPNYAMSRINGDSDFVNFFPVVLNLSNALQMLPPSDGYEYHLVQDDSAVKFVYTDLKLVDPFNYQTNSAGMYGFGSGSNYWSAFAPTIQITAAPGVTLANNWLMQIQNSGGKGIILVEGNAATAHPLWLEIWRNGKLLCGTPLYLSISGVEQMFRHANFCYINGTVDPNNLSRAIAPNEPTNDGKNLVFVHGYNVNQQEARGVESEMFKRFYWSGSQANFYGVTWNGAESKENAIIQHFPRLPVAVEILCAPQSNPSNLRKLSRRNSMPSYPASILCPIWDCETPSDHQAHRHQKLRALSP
jgi:hypothetical protein